MGTSTMDKAIALFDALNRQDPNSILWNGLTYPAEYFYALQLYNWVKKLAPDPSEALLLASRSQHIGRWQVPRHQYPKGKAGYFKWRTDLARYHANKAGELMLEAGCEQETIRAVQHIILKENLKTDPEVQIMENALCLVFLEFQYPDFLTRHDDQKVIRILQRSWAKMTVAGREAAMSINYTDKGRFLLEKALG
ncbi:MAG TPA: DUF4202 domain-containing protein [Segetibacter sp.]|nr:DUF4202 domain-containing protein [Segetibacter sp.]